MALDLFKDKHEPDKITDRGVYMTVLDACHNNTLRPCPACGSCEGGSAQMLEFECVSCPNMICSENKSFPHIPLEKSDLIPPLLSSTETSIVDRLVIVSNIRCILSCLETSVTPGRMLEGRRLWSKCVYTVQSHTQEKWLLFM